MNAISVLQPWAWLLAAGHKDIENRCWCPPVALIGQRIAIHASNRIVLDEYEWATELIEDERLGIELPSTASITRGAVIGTAVIAEIVKRSPSPWFVGPFGWRIEDPQLWPEPVPFRGRLGIWQFPDNLIPQEVAST